MNHKGFARSERTGRYLFIPGLAAIVTCALVSFSTDARAQTQAAAASGHPKTFLSWLAECPLFASDTATPPGVVAATPPEKTPDGGKQPEPKPNAALPADSDTVFSHSQTSPFWISGQGNFIFQWHPRFHAAYNGAHSFDHASEQAVSRVLTLYTGFRLNDTTELVVDAESRDGAVSVRRWGWRATSISTL